LLNEHKLERIFCGKRLMRTLRLPQPVRQDCRPRSRLRKRSSASRRPWRTRAQKEAGDLKKKLEDAEWKAKDATADL
jgi:hypothetical protein